MLAGLLVLATAGSLAACGGPGASVLAPPAAPALPFATTTSAPLSVANGTGVVLWPSADGFGASADLPLDASTSAITYTATLQSQAPLGVVPLGRRRTAQIGHSTIVYAGVAFASNVTTSGPPTLTFLLPPWYLQPNLAWYVALLGPDGVWNTAYATAASIAGGVRFTGPAPLSFAARNFVWFALFVQPPGGTPSPVPTPTVAPTARPAPTPTSTATERPTVLPSAAPTATPAATAAPTAVPTVSPSAAPTAIPAATATPTAVPTVSPTPTPGPLSLSSTSVALGATGDVARVTATQPNGGPFTAVSSNAAVAAATVDQRGTIAITAAAAGECIVTVTGAGGAQAAITVTVTTLSFPVH